MHRVVRLHVALIFFDQTLSIFGLTFEQIWLNLGSTFSQKPQKLALTFVRRADVFGKLFLRDFVGGGPDEFARAEVLEAECHVVRDSAAVADGGAGPVKDVVAGVPVGGEREPARFGNRLTWSALQVVGCLA